MFAKIAGFLNLLWRIPIVSQLSVVLKAAVVRGIRSAIGAVMAVLVANAVAGTLFPRDWGQVTIVVLVGFVLALDKWLREKGLQEDAAVATK